MTTGEATPQHRRPRRTLLSSIGWLSGGSLVTRVVGALSGIITARALGAEGRGELAIALVIGMIAGGVLPLGLDLWAARALGGGADLSAVRRLLRWQLAGAAFVVTAGVGLTVAIDSEDPTLWAATGLLCVTATAATIRLGVLQGLDEMRGYSVASMLSTVLYAAVLLVLVIADRVSVTEFVLAAALGQTVVVCWPARDRRHLRTSGSTPQYRAAVRFGLPTAAGAVSALLLYRLDVLLVTLWSGVQEAGWYSVALAYTELTWVVPTAAAQALVPHAAKPDPTVDTPRLCRSVVLFMVVAAVALTLLGPALVPWLFGSDFDDAVPAIAPLAMASIGVGVWKLIGHDLIARGDARARLMSGIAGIAVMVVVDAILVPRWGIRGAAVGSIAAYATAASLVTVLWCRREGVGPQHLLVPRPSDVAYILRRARQLPTTSRVDP